MSNADAARYTTAHIPADYPVHVSAETASRDYTATAVPGDYPVQYTDVQYRPVRDGERPYYVTIRVLIDTPTRRESTVEFGGVALASREVQGERIGHTIVRYAYEVKEGKLGAIRLS